MRSCSPKIEMGRNVACLAAKKIKKNSPASSLDERNVCWAFNRTHGFSLTLNKRFRLLFRIYSFIWEMKSYISFLHNSNSIRFDTKSSFRFEISFVVWATMSVVPKRKISQAFASKVYTRRQYSVPILSYKQAEFVIVSEQSDPERVPPQAFSTF